MGIDWGKLSEQFGGRFGRDAARTALSDLLGEKEIRSAVRQYVNGCHGSELVFTVLRLLKPHAARDECLKIYYDECDSEKRVAAVELFRVVANAEALGTVPSFLQDGIPAVQVWGASVVDYLVLDGECRDAALLASCLQLMHDHSNPDVVETGERVEAMLSGMQHGGST